jgi:ectoine hydroxylase-related dioxygenase (phytanoyl-CoA dioxygenase family)
MAAAISQSVEDSTQADVAAQYERDGYFVAPGLLGEEEAAEIRDTFTGYAEGGPIEGLSEMQRITGATYDPGDPLRRFPRMMQPHRHLDKPVGPLTLQYLLDARIGELLRQLLDDEPIAAQSMFYFKPPGARGQDFHQDNFYLRVKPGTCIAAWIAIDDVDPDNGGMMVVPGTQGMEIVCPEATADRLRFFTDHHVPIPVGLEPMPVIMKAGDVLFFNGSLIHGSYPNSSTDRFRRSLIFHYVPSVCVEVAAGYHPLLDFNGQVVLRDDAHGGGPCGAPLSEVMA